ncbi:hypothetical protein [Deinococcus cellulosilyticus]|uniref:Uncharacterized protein n=1 Tax=Deinococcus cellulosilyticus (strain DSM 18568 / NBRC 106333 / KACC 11606 / 5516J-15) TaxID=1223518 RepID=A0A511N3D9_DEIC1|nr:hypothetical protein [Deinococcus cellulosilyticus]GEM47385.1 hypothetical protein DC3_30200 [Deinococcus cellulosilyticus NBRC 106333 = KACC 11606]
MKKFLLTAALLFATQAFAQDSMEGHPMPAPAAPTEEQMAEMAETAMRLGLPEGTIKISECVPGMGEHWARPQDLPLGPIYGVLDGSLVFVEIMPSHADFIAGKSWVDVLKTPKWFLKINHVDIEFLPQGHDGYPVPHYDIHAYYVSHDEHMGFCPPPAP